ncbi:ribosome maturation factor RimP [Kineococcus sp. SYSU DK004]|uniref:ribosome maturation factor RimP n=1 Tax=Kineococcus sp. SYSU DK004 TaxID=3383125 RepID=UPI003D7CB454
MPSSEQSAPGALPDVLTGVLTGPVQRAGLALEDVAVTTAGRRRVVRVVVDLAGDEPGEVDLDAVAVASQAVSEALDASGALGEVPYTLEVSSPGVDRPLTSARHFSRARGRLVRVLLREGGDVLGRVEAVTGDGDDAVVLLRLEPQPVKGRPPRAADVGAPREVALADVLRGEVQVEFRRAGDAPAGGEVDDADELDDDVDEDEDER